MDRHIERLVVAGDLHAFIEPLHEVDRIIGESPERTQVIVAGDILLGGANPTETLEWVRVRADKFAVPGNVECALLDNPGNKTLQRTFSQLNARQIEYLRGLPHVLHLSWHGMRIQVLHGHRTRSGESVPWQSRPSELLDRFADLAVNLTVVGHTHYPFVSEKDGACVANCGSTSQLILGRQEKDGTVVAQGDEPVFTPVSEIYSTFLSIAAENGQPRATVERFDYDRRAAIRRLRETGEANVEAREAWLMTGVHPA